MATIGAGVSLRGIEHDEFHYPFNLAAGTVVADASKAVSLDTSAANTVKLAADGDAIVGKLVTVEDRTIEGILVGAVALKGGFKFTIKSGETVAIGDTVVGAGAGEVKAAAAANHSVNMVVEIIGTTAIVVL
jgi:hypothetical protein